MNHHQPSQLSTLFPNSNDVEDICRICHCEGEPDCVLIFPCYCSGTLRYVHNSCLEKWIKSSGKKSCEICKFDYIIHAQTKPFRKWEKMKLTFKQEMMLVFSILIHIVAIPVVVFILVLLITAREIDWFFWLNLIIIILGVLGEIIFIYIQCRMYRRMFRKWRDFNKILHIQNAPEKENTILQQQQQQTISVVSFPRSISILAVNTLTDCSIPYSKLDDSDISVTSLPVADVTSHL